MIKFYLAYLIIILVNFSIYFILGIDGIVISNLSYIISYIMIYGSWEEKNNEKKD